MNVFITLCSHARVFSSCINPKYICGFIVTPKAINSAPIIMCVSRNFLFRGGGGGGVVGVWTTCFFLVLNLLYNLQRGSNGTFYYRENYTFPRIQRGSNIFKGVQLLQGGGGGLNANFYRNHITCNFSGGFGPPIPPPLWIRT